MPDLDFRFEELADNASIKAEFHGYKDGLVRVLPGDWVMSPLMASLLPKYNTMEIRPQDVWVVTYPKCGTTWSQELVWQVVHGVDLEVGGKKDLSVRFPFLEIDSIADLAVVIPSFLLRCLFYAAQWWMSFHLPRPSSWLGYKNTKELLDDKPKEERRFIKSHLPFSLLPPELIQKAKVIYVARNPKDVIVSYYHHHKLLTGHGYIGDLPNFAKRFMKNELMFGPFFPHVEEAWEMRDNPNILFIFYEDMKKDLREVISKVSKFLDSPLREEQVERLVEHLDIKNFRKNPAVNFTDIGKSMGFVTGDGNFVRKGEVGGWKAEFSQFPLAEAELNQWIEEQLARCPVPFRL